MPLGYSGAPRVTGSNQASRTRRLSRSLVTGNNGTPMRMTLYSSEQFNYYASPDASNTDALRPVVEIFSSEFDTHSAFEVGYYKDIGYLRLKNMTNGAIVFSYDIDSGFTFVGDLGITGNVQVSGAVNVNGAVQLNSTLNTVGAVIFSNTLTVEGHLLANTTFTATGAAIFNNTVNFNDAVQMNSTLNTVGAVTFHNTVNVNTINGIDYNPGSDTSVDLITISVTTTPKISFDFIGQKFVSTHGLRVEGSTSAEAGSIQITASDPSIRFKWTSSPTVDKNTFELRFIGTGASEYLQFRSINDANTVFTTVAAIWHGGGMYIGTTPVDPGLGSLYVSNTLNAVGAATFHNTVNVNTANGIDYNPGSDIDIDLMTLFVGGDYRLWWDQSQTKFRYTAGFQVDNGSITVTGSDVIAIGAGSPIGIQLRYGNTPNLGELICYDFVNNAPKTLHIRGEVINLRTGIFGNQPGIHIGNTANVGIAIEDPKAKFHVYGGSLMVDGGEDIVLGPGGPVGVQIRYGTVANTSEIISFDFANIIAKPLNIRGYTINLQTGVFGSVTAIGIENDGTSTFYNTVNVNTVNGIDYNPGSDIDVDLITVGVTGAPRLRWDESEDNFSFTHGIYVSGVVRSGQTQTITGNATVNTNATLVLCNLSANATLTLTAVALNDGRDLYIKRIDNTTAILTVDPDGSELIDGANTAEVIGQYEAIHIRCGASAWWIV